MRNPERKWAKDLNRPLTKEEIQITNIAKAPSLSLLFLSSSPEAGVYHNKHDVE